MSVCCLPTYLPDWTEFAVWCSFFTLWGKKKKLVAMEDFLQENLRMKTCIWVLRSKVWLLHGLSKEFTLGFLLRTKLSRTRFVQKLFFVLLCTVSSLSWCSVPQFVWRQSQQDHLISQSTVLCVNSVVLLFFSVGRATFLYIYNISKTHCRIMHL